MQCIYVDYFFFLLGLKVRWKSIQEWTCSACSFNNIVSGFKIYACEEWIYFSRYLLIIFFVWIISSRLWVDLLWNFLWTDLIQQAVLI
jgi:hypothetical protein